MMNMEEKANQNRFCVVCCCSYSVVDNNLEVRSWKNNTSFEKFLVELEKSSGSEKGTNNVSNKKARPKGFNRKRLLKSLEAYGDQVAVCWECLEYIQEAVEMETRVSAVEKEVARMQKELIGELRKLQGHMTEYYEKMKRIVGSVTNSDVSYLENLLQSQEKGKRSVEELIAFREKITAVAVDVDRFQNQMGNTFNFDIVPTLTVMASEEATKTRKRKTFSRAQQKIKEELMDFGGYDDNDFTTDPFIDNELTTETTHEDVTHDDFDNADNDVDFIATNSENSSEDDDESNFDNVRDFGLSNAPPRKKKASKSSKKSGLSSTPAPVIKFNNMSRLKILIVKAIVRRQSIHARLAPQQEVANPMDLPVELRYPFVYDNTTKNMTIGGAIVTLQKSQFCCSLCDFKTTPAENYNRPQRIIDSIYNHVAGQHFSAFQCNICSRKYLHRKKFKQHCLTHKNPASFACEICGKPMASSESLIRHKWLHLNEEEKKEALENGSAPYMIRYQLKTQDAQNNDESSSSTLNFICATCGKGFGSQAKLRKHEINMHTEQTVICPQCGKSCKASSYRIYHQRYVCPVGVFQANARRHQCLECDKTFQSKKGLKSHFARTHSSEAIMRSFICHVCGKGYKTEGDMKVHARTHNIDKPWCCEKCGKEFNIKRNLMRHVCRVAMKVEASLIR